MNRWNNSSLLADGWVSSLAHRGPYCRAECRKAFFQIIFSDFSEWDNFCEHIFYDLLAFLVGVRDGSAEKRHWRRDNMASKTKYWHS